MFLSDYQFSFIENLIPGKKSDSGRTANNRLFIVSKRFSVFGLRPSTRFLGSGSFSMASRWTEMQPNKTRRRTVDENLYRYGFQMNCDR